MKTLEKYKIAIKILKIVSLFFFYFLLPNNVYLDAGLKLTSRSLTNILITLFVIILIEAIVYKIILKVKLRKTILVSLISNFISTIVGTPVLIIIDIYILFHIYSYLSQFIPFIRDLRLSNIDVLNLLTAFFITLIIEYLVIKQFFKLEDKSKIKKAVIVANIITYLLLIIILIKRIIF